MTSTDFIVGSSENQLLKSGNLDREFSIAETWESAYKSANIAFPLSSLFSTPNLRFSEKELEVRSDDPAFDDVQRAINLRGRGLSL